ncbi:MAG: nicotinamide mononucleotide transporter [Flammeovirgaceae bacterium]|nr:nicotinamide mononucleotide transporter [Flammeovirgaceae bacterium]
MTDFLSLFISQLVNTPYLEITAVFFGLVSVWYAKKEEIWVYPTGIISLIIYIGLTFQYKLYGDMGIQIYYLIMSIYGWYFWIRGKGAHTPVQISKNNKQENKILFLLFLGSFLLIRYGLGLTDSDIPGWDALTSALAIVGMWLMARKKIEHWIAWIAVDSISVPLYLYKGLPLTSFQFLIFTILAGWGYLTWNIKLKSKES